MHAVLRLPDEKKLLTIALLWSWWTERNRGNHGERRLGTDEFQYSVRRHVNDWTEFLTPKLTAQQTTVNL